MNHPQFEYAVVTFDTTAFLTGAKLNHERYHQKLNEYGAEGWELVSVFDLNRFHGESFEVVATFKRRKS